MNEEQLEQHAQYEAEIREHEDAERREKEGKGIFRKTTITQEESCYPEIDIYNMALHERVTLPGTGVNVWKVPGGWIYDFGGDGAQTEFVPYIEEIGTIKIED